MESKRMMVFVTVMLVLGNLLVQTEAEAQTTSPFRKCYPPCILSCAIEKKFPNALTCAFTCIIPCLAPKASAPPTQLSVANETDDLEYFCKIGCATHHCVSVSSDLQNLNVDKVADCVDSCSEKCSNKN